MNRLKLLKNSKGFTLIELLIVMVIIGLLAALVVNQFTNARDDAEDSEAQSDISQASQKLEEYYTRNGYYPAALADITDMKPDTRTHSGGLTYTYTAGTTIAAGSPDTVTGTCTTAGEDCTEYVLHATLNDGSVFEKSSL